jgi:prepilin-type N-terminal cleavage/methylation domain-containing protein
VLFFSLQMTTHKHLRLTPFPQAGFTLTEAAVAIAVIGISMTAFVMTMTSLNESASITRNATGAAAVIQNQVDLIQSDGPFNPQKTNSDGSPQIPPELTLGTHITNGVPIYKEPVTGTIVSGTLTTTVVDVSPILNGITMPLYRADVQVTYTYRNKTYTLNRSTLRASDI